MKHKKAYNIKILLVQVKFRKLQKLEIN